MIEAILITAVVAFGSGYGFRGLVRKDIAKVVAYGKALEAKLVADAKAEETSVVKTVESKL